MEKVVSWTQIQDIDSIKKAGNFQLLYSAWLCVCERDDTQQRHILKLDSFKDLELAERQSYKLSGSFIII